MNERLKLLRKTLGLTQQSFADALSLKRQTVASYEIGKISPSASTIAFICKEFHVNEEWLRTGNGKMFQDLSDNIPIDMAVYTPDQQHFIIEFYQIYKDLTPTQQEALLVIAKQLADKKS